MMNEKLYWGILVLFAGILLALIYLLRHYLIIRGNVAVRSMLHTERMTALSKDMPPPVGDSFPVVTTKVSRFGNVYLAKLTTILGLILLFSGIGMGIGFLYSIDTLKKWASLSWIAILTGLGLLAYIFFARCIFDKEDRDNKKQSDRGKTTGSDKPADDATSHGGITAAPASGAVADAQQKNPPNKVDDKGDGIIPAQPVTTAPAPPETSKS